MKPLAALALLVVLGGCGSKTPDGAQIRPNVHLIHEGSWSQSGCLEFDPVRCTMFQSSDVLSLAVVGDDYYLLTMLNGGWGLALHTSRDRGVTWTTRFLQSLAPNWAGNGYLVAAGDRLFMVLPFDEEGALGMTWRRCRSFTLDPETGDYAAVTTPEVGIVGCQAPSSGSAVTEYSYEVDPRGAGTITGSFHYRKDDLATGVHQGTVLACDRDGCGTHSAEMLGSFGHHWSLVGEATRVCSIGVIFSSYTDTVGRVAVAACSTAPLFQQESTPTQAFVDGKLGFEYAQDGHLFLASLDANAPDNLKTLDLGEGTSLGRGLDGLSRIHGPGTDTSILQLRLGKPHRVGLPRTPCVSDSSCMGGSILKEQSRIVWAKEVAKGEFLVVYRFQEIDDPEGTTTNWTGRMREKLFVALEKDSNVPATATGTATELEKTCARLVGCFQGETLHGCTDRWFGLRGATSEADLAYQAFLATPPGCDGFLSSDPVGTRDQATCVSGCQGAVARSCEDAGPGQYAVNCRESGTSCDPTPDSTAIPGVSSYFACERPTGCEEAPFPSWCDGDRRIYCPSILEDCAALGLACGDFEGPACVLRDRSCSAPFCDGTLAYRCSSSGAAAPDADCARIGLPCRDGRCVAPDVLEPTPKGQDHCDGTRLVYDLSLQTPEGWLPRERTLDCASLGLRCVANQTALTAGCAQ